MSSLIKNVAKWVGVCVMALVLYVFFFGTSDFFVFESGSDTTGGYDGAIAMVIEAVEKPMAIYYDKYTYLPNQQQMTALEKSITSSKGDAVKCVYNP